MSGGRRQLKLSDNFTDTTTETSPDDDAWWTWANFQHACAALGPRTCATRTRPVNNVSHRVLHHCPALWLLSESLEAGGNSQSAAVAILQQAAEPETTAIDSTALSQQLAAVLTCATSWQRTWQRSCSKWRPRLESQPNAARARPPCSMTPAPPRTSEQSRFMTLLLKVCLRSCTASHACTLAGSVQPGYIGHRHSTPMPLHSMILRSQIATAT